VCVLPALARTLNEAAVLKQAQLGGWEDRLQSVTPVARGLNAA
jgi:hypothetical protein